MKEEGKEAGKKKAGWQEKRNREKVKEGKRKMVKEEGEKGQWKLV